MKQYMISWYTKENRQIFEHSRTMEAPTAKAARRCFDEWWEQSEAERSRASYFRHPGYPPNPHKPRHAFGVEVKLIRNE